VNKNAVKKPDCGEARSFEPKIELYNAFHVPFTSPGYATNEAKQIDACCACTACSACTACG